jgi:hypothetical protein
MIRFAYRSRWAWAAAVAVLLTACASSPEVDPRQIQQAEIAIDEAQEVNASRFAAGTLARAEERLMDAREAMDRDDNDRARRLLEEAVVLAELAEARALEKNSEQSLAQIRENLNVLEERLN